MKSLLFYLFGSVILVSSVSTHAENLKIEIIPLKYRTASELIPVIRPFLADGGTVTGMNDQIIVKSTPANISELRILLESIDNKLRNLLITVTSEITEASGREDHSVTGHYSSENIEIIKNPRFKDRKRNSISVYDADTGNIKYSLDSDNSSLTDKNKFQLQTLEGQPAFIETGRLVPLHGRTAYVTGNGTVVQDTVEYHDSSSGFYVVPNLNGDIVTLLVSPNMSRENQDRKGTFNIQNIETTVQGRLGDWIEIGGITQRSQRNNSGILYNKERSLNSERSVLIKVEELK